MGETGVFGKSAGAVIAIAMVMCALCIDLVGCATQHSGNVTSEQDETSAVEKATIATRTVTFPALFFQDTVAEDVQANLQEGLHRHRRQRGRLLYRDDAYRQVQRACGLLA